MGDSYLSFVIVASVAFLAPLLLGLAPRLLIPSLVVELVGGILIGPSVLGIAEVDDPVVVFSQVGLVALLYLAGREIRVDMLTGPVVSKAVFGFATSLVLAAAIGLAMGAADLVTSPLFIAIILAATSLSIIVVPIRDVGEADTAYGQQVLTAGAISEFAAVILLAFAGSGSRGGFETELVHLIAFGLLAVALALALAAAESRGTFNALFRGLSGGSAQIGVRGDLALLGVVVGLGVELGLEAVLAAFAVGVIRGMNETDDRGREKLEAVALGIFVPFFFVVSGMELDLGELTASASNLLMMPLFLVALLVARGVPALLYRGIFSRDLIAAAALLQATTLSFVIVATQLGDELGLISEATIAALVGAGLLSVILFPALALMLIRRDRAAATPSPLGGAGPGAPDGVVSPEAP